MPCKTNTSDNDEIRQKIVKLLSKQIRAVRVTYPRKVYKYTGLFGPWKQWELQVNGHCISSSCRGRDGMRANRRDEIQRRASRIMEEVTSLQNLGFQVTLPNTLK